jgi:hypothetical protein
VFNAALADSARTDERYQAAVGSSQQCTDLREFLPPPDQRHGWGRKTRRRRRAGLDLRRQRAGFRTRLNSQLSAEFPLHSLEDPQGVSSIARAVRQSHGSQRELFGQGIDRDSPPHRRPGLQVPALLIHDLSEGRKAIQELVLERGA